MPHQSLMKKESSVTKKHEIIYLWYFTMLHQKSINSINDYISLLVSH